MRLDDCERNRCFAHRPPLQSCHPSFLLAFTLLTGMQASWPESRLRYSWTQLVPFWRLRGPSSQAADHEDRVRVMSATVLKVELAEIPQPGAQPSISDEMNCQIRYNACHERGWTDSYVLMFDDARVGYGSIKGREIKDRDTVFEYFVIQPWRNRASELFCQLISASGAQLIECQSNDVRCSLQCSSISHL